MSELSKLRELIAPPTEETFTGTVVGVGINGVFSVLSGAKAVTCFSTLPLQVGERVRVQGLVILTKVSNPANDIPIFKV
jgi:hypothetical protein